MMKNKTKHKIIVLTAFSFMSVFAVFLMLDAIGEMQEKDTAIKGGVNYLGQPVGPEAKLLVSIIVLVISIICFIFFLKEKSSSKKQKLPGKQKKKARKFDTLQSQNNFRRF